MTKEGHLLGPRPIGRPTPGYYKLRKIRGGVMVAHRIVLSPTPDPYFPNNDMSERPHFWGAIINGEPETLTEITPTPMVWRIHEWGEQITKEEYDLMLEQAAWDKQYAPDSPQANPDRKVDLRTMPTLF